MALSRSRRWPDRILFWLPCLAIYGLLFALLRSWSSHWATADLFSLWFPAAGLRFALLWWGGLKLAPAAALAELAGSLVTQTLSLSPLPLVTLLGVIGPCLIYGLVIHVVRATIQSRAALGGFDPLPFGAAAVIGPLCACVAALTWALPRSGEALFANPQALFEAMLVFALGDLLGILLLAPLLLALAYAATSNETLRWSLPSVGKSLEIAVVFGLGWLLVWSMDRADYGIVLAPVLLATCWAGLRGGRVAAWTCILASAAIILPMSGANGDDVQRVHAHMLLACIAAGGYLLGSYADAQALATAEIRRRDRLLLQAERLKTLRAMSLGVIHDVSQPLSTIALEANSLVAATASARPDPAEVRDMAERISRKAGDLSELVRRLRRFGEGAADERSLISPQVLLSDVLGLLEPEAQAAGLTLSASRAPQALLEVSDVEVRQALLNLGRNALQASPSPGGTVWLGCALDEGDVVFTFDNRTSSQPPRRAGMRIGLLIARAIARAHGGSVKFEAAAEGRVRCSLRLPTARQDPA